MPLQECSTLAAELTTPAAILTIATTAIWLYLFFFRGQFWRLRKFDDEQTDVPVPRPFPKVHAIIPARNEAQTIAAAVGSLLAQNYAGQFSVTVVDDHSTDQTAQVATKAAASSSAVLPARPREPACVPARSFTIQSSAPLPATWTGKLWALDQGVTKILATSELQPEYFWFTDADITHAPDTLDRLVARAEKENLDLVSLMVLLKSETLPEKLLIPPFLYFFLQLYPPRWIAKTKTRTAGAAGGCLLIRTSALQKIGGLACVRSAMIDDCAIAAAVKHSNGSLWMGITRRSLSLRNYASFTEIRDMIARTAYTQLKYSPPLLALTLLALLVTYLAPIALLFTGVWQVRVAATFATVLMLTTFLPTTGFYGQSALWAFTLPGAAVFYGYATALSAVRYWRGQGGQWKGRAQAPIEPPQ
jgi:hopene-associated glycosyltransferase HpnB